MKHFAPKVFACAGLIAGTLTLAACTAKDNGGAPNPAPAGLNGMSLLRPDGSPRLPSDYTGTDWIQIGTWAIAPGQGKDVNQQHLVYTQREAAEAFKKDRRWPDGAVLVKELRTAAPNTMTTGFSAPAGDLTGWFVMVKGSKQPKANTPHWGGGWYGAQYAADKNENVSPGWVSCRGCHTPVKDTDWTFIQGYPRLQQ